MHYVYIFIYLQNVHKDSFAVFLVNYFIITKKKNEGQEEVLEQMHWAYETQQVTQES